MILLVLQATLISFTTVAQGAVSTIDTPRQVVIRTAPEWQSLWKGHNPGTSTPPVDFTRLVVVGVFLGARPTAGFTVEITAVTKAAGGTLVTYRERRPSPGALVAQVLTSPFHLVSLPRDTGSIEFRQNEP